MRYLIDASTVILILYMYTLGVTLAGLFYVRRSCGVPNTEVCRYCRFYRLCSRLGLNRLAPPIKYVRGVPRKFKTYFITALSTGYVTVLVLALMACREALPYLGASLILPATIAYSVIKLDS